MLSDKQPLIHAKQETESCTYVVLTLDIEYS